MIFFNYLLHQIEREQAQVQKPQVQKEVQVQRIVIEVEVEVDQRVQNKEVHQWQVKEVMVIVKEV